MTAEVVARIRELDAAGKTLREIAGATGVSTFSVRSALGRVASRSQAPAAGHGDAGRDSTPDQRDGEAAVANKPLPVLPDPVPRDGERALARGGCSAKAPSRSCLSRRRPRGTACQHQAAALLG